MFTDRTSAPAFAAALLWVALAPVARAAVRLEGGWSRPAPAGLPTGVGYGVLVNDGPRPVRLTGASTPAARAVEFHETMRMTGPMGPMSHMAPLASVEVPAHGSVAFAPNGRHMMLVGLRRALTTGERVPLVLTFAGAPPVRAALAVRPTAP
jgi:periplasmic copper chaperone A